MAQAVCNEWKDVCRIGSRAEGRMEKALESALNLLRANVAVETISMCLGLTLEKAPELAAGLKREQSGSR